MRIFFYFVVIALTFTMKQGVVVAQPNQDLVEQHLNSAVTFSLSVTDNKMTAKVESATLADVLEEFSRLTGVKISVTEVREKELVLASFENLSFAEGIKKIVGDNYTLIMGQSDANPETSVLTEIKILDRSLVDYQDDSTNNNSKEYDQQQLSQMALDKNADSIARIKALDELSNVKRKLQGTEFNQVFENALEDENEEIRLAAIEAIQREALEVDLDVLRNASSYDDSADIRKMALDEVADRSEPKAAREWLAQAIEKDSDPAVREFAQATLKQLKAEHAWLYKGKK